MSKAQEMREITDAANSAAKEKQAEQTTKTYQTKILPRIEKLAKEGDYSYSFLDECNELDADVLATLATKDGFDISSYVTWLYGTRYTFSWNKPAPKAKKKSISFKLNKKD